MIDLTLVGRSSSHFTRTARIFALDLGVPHTFRPVLDMTLLGAENYADNPALKVPVLVDDHGPLYGTENICRELARRSRVRSRVVLPGDLAERLVANAEELTLHVMSTGVLVVMAKVAGAEASVSPKVQRSLENSLAYLESRVDQLVTVLPADRVLSFVEAALFCVVRHLPFRQIMDVSPYKRLAAFCDRFGEHDGAQRTEYRFDGA